MKVRSLLPCGTIREVESNGEWAYRSTLGRAYGVLAVGVGALLVVLGFTYTAEPADPPAWVFAVLGVVFMVSGVSVLRAKVSVGPSGIDIAGAIRVKRIGWGEIERFQRAPTQGVMVLLRTGESVAFASGSALGRRRQEAQAIRLRDHLEDLRRRYQVVTQSAA